MRYLFAVVLLICGIGSAAAEPMTVNGGRLGAVHLAFPARPRGLVVLFADDPATTESVTRAVTGLGAAVAAVDLRSYLAALRTSGGECLYLVGEIENLSHWIQRRLGFKEYRLPILAGIGPGAGLVYGALAQAPAATVAGAASVDFTPVIATRTPLCPGATAEPTGDGMSFRYAPRANPPGWWRVAGTRPAGADLARFVAQVGGAELVSVDAKGDARSDAAAAMDRLLRSVLAAELPDAGATGKGADVTNLPVTALPVAGDPAMMAVIYSGDGGWRDLDKQIGETLAADGVPVVGVDSLRYFWREKTPERIARDLGRIIAHYGDAWGTRRVILIGYSFGADILPFAVNRLDPGTRTRIVQVSLLGLAPEADFEIHVTDWLGLGPGRGARAVLPEATRIAPGLLQCFYGEEEDDTACTNRALARSEIIETKGGHHFDGDYGALAEKILSGARKRLGTTL